MKDKILNYLMAILLVLLIVMAMFKTTSKDFQNKVYRIINNIKIQSLEPKPSFKPQATINENKPSSEKAAGPDFGPYMKELQKSIKSNWYPPKRNESKRVVLLFKIAKNGRLLSTKIFKSSGVAAADEAAIKAVMVTAPFKSLPKEFKGKSIDIQFTFDYNVRKK